ncbi:MAG TPA: methyltransferase domain-containing protein [Chitinophagales bacterium]|nr:methyltransferase domain-containing protein [Chitinophagales bacterium]
MDNNFKQQSEKVSQYYDNWQKGYNDVYGDTIQAFRPTDKEALMGYLAQAAGIKNGLHVLDAGCGVAGPAVWLAEHFDIKIEGITISGAQVKQANTVITEKNLGGKIKVQQGDYHELSNLYQPATFNLVLFLESLGHAGDPAKAIAEAFAVLKPGGSIYIKDFYYKEPDNEHWKARISKTIGNINRSYQYNTLNLGQVLQALRRVGFEIEFIRRFEFKDDISIRQEFETRFGIDIFGGEPEFTPAEWLEIKCLKSEYGTY